MDINRLTRAHQRNALGAVRQVHDKDWTMIIHRFLFLYFIILSGVPWTLQRKTLISIPIILFLLTCLYTKNDEIHFIANFISLIVCIIPKLPSFHHRRLFGINKY